MRVAYFCTTLGAQVVDSEAGACHNCLCRGNKCLLYTGKYKAQYWVPRCNICWFVVVKQLKEAARKGPFKDTGIPSPMYK